MFGNQDAVLVLFVEESDDLADGRFWFFMVSAGSCGVEAAHELAHLRREADQDRQGEPCSGSPGGCRHVERVPPTIRSCRAHGKWRDAPGSPHTKKTGGDLMNGILSTLAIPPAPMKVHTLRSTFNQPGARGRRR